MENVILYVAEWIGAIAVGMIAGVSPRFRKSRLVFKYPRREGIIALTVFALVLLLALVLRFWVAPFSISGLPLAQSGRLFLAAGGIVSVLVALWRRKQPVRSAGWGRDKFFAALQLGLALAFLTIFLHGKLVAIINGLSGQELSPLVYLILVVFLEETVFRGYIQLRLASWWGENIAWLVTAGFFVVCHIPRLLLASDMWQSLLILAGQSVVAGFIMTRSGHTLAPMLYRSVSEWLLFVL